MFLYRKASKLFTLDRGLRDSWVCVSFSALFLLTLVAINLVWVIPEFAFLVTGNSVAGVFFNELAFGWLNGAPDSLPSLYEANGFGLLTGLLASSSAMSETKRSKGQDDPEFASDDKIHRLFEQIPGMVYQLRYDTESGDFWMPFTSHRIQDIFGLSPEIVADDATLLIEQIHPDDRDSFEEAMLESAETLEKWKHHYRVCLAPERVIWVKGQATPERLEDGSILWCGHLEDVTSRHEERQLLTHTCEQAKASERTIHNFVSTMSHEIRTPMNAIIGLSDLLHSTELNDEQADIVAMIIDSGNTLLGQVSDVLDYTEIGAEELIIVNERFEPAELVRKLKGIANSLSNRRSIGFSTYFDSDVPAYCYGDEARLTQVILNLISNAVKFSSEGGHVEFHISATYASSVHATIHFVVVDHGVGLSQEEQDRLIAPFATPCEESTSGVQRGGLGLAISAKLCQLMGGKLSCESAIGLGSRFSFSVPLNLREQSTRETLSPKAWEKAHEAPQIAASHVEPSALNVLIVDDDPTSLQTISLMLGKLGIKAACAENGHEAMHACLAEQFDLLFMDLEMPVMDGIRATKLIHDTVPMMQRPRIIALTGFPCDEKREACFGVGMDDFIGKPLQDEQLSRVVMASLKLKRHLIS